MLSLLTWLPAAGPFAEGGFLAPDALTAELVVATLFWALCEEVIWRGLLLRSLETRLGSGLALVVTALTFAVWHWRWDYYALLDLTVAGALFGALFLLTRRVWLSTGVHTGWNLALWAWTEPEMWWSATYELILMLEGAAILAALLLARQRGRLVRRPRGGVAAAPTPMTPAVAAAVAAPVSAGGLEPLPLPPPPQPPPLGPPGATAPEGQTS